MRYLLTIGIAASLTACGDGGSHGASAPSGAPAEKPSSMPGASIVQTTTVQTATRDDVIHALRCHLSLSKAMAKDIAADDAPARRYGAAISYWHDRIGQLADGAGVSEADRKEIRKQVLESQRKTPETEVFTDACYAQAPGA